MHWWKSMIIFLILSRTLLLSLGFVVFALSVMGCAGVHAGAPVRVVERVLKTHGCRGNSHDWERSKGQILKSLKRHLIWKNSSYVLHFLAGCHSCFFFLIYRTTLFPPPVQQSSHYTVFPTAPTVFSMLFSPMIRPFEAVGHQCRVISTI